VLSTPPAFVLSQDQTLREELLALQRAVAHLTRARPYTRPQPDAIDEVCFLLQVPSGARMHRRRFFDEPGRTDRNATALGRSRSVRMLLSFQRPWRLRSGGASSAVAHSEPFPSGHWSVARPESRVQAPRRLPPARRGTVAVGAGYASTCTWTSRRRGRSSKSISTSCCQVPSTSRPPTSGTLSDGPTNDARRCACALSSWLRTLWA
jgi:hypothetical protein